MDNKSNRGQYIKYLIITASVICLVMLLGDGVEKNIDGHIDQEWSDIVLQGALIMSLLLNIVFIDRIVIFAIREINNVDEEFDHLYNYHENDDGQLTSNKNDVDIATRYRNLRNKYYSTLSSLLYGLQAMNRLVSDIIADEKGEETATCKYENIEEFASILKQLIDLHIDLINKSSKQ